MGQTIRVFASGCAVYVIMAACSTVEVGGSAQSTSGGGHGMGGVGHGGAGQGVGGDSGIFDVLLDPVPKADADPQSGSRLKGKFWVGSDGAKEYEHFAPPQSNDPLGVRAIWYDSQRQEDCTLATASDGKTRCLPLIRSVSFDSVARYTDPQCTTPILILPKLPPGCLSVPKYATDIVYGTCASAAYPLRYFPVGAPIPQPSSIYINNPNGCGFLEPGQASSDYRALGAEIDPASFVEMTAGIDP